MQTFFFLPVKSLQPLNVCNFRIVGLSIAQTITLYIFYSLNTANICFTPMSRYRIFENCSENNQFHTSCFQKLCNKNIPQVFKHKNYNRKFYRTKITTNIQPCVELSVYARGRLMTAMKISVGWDNRVYIFSLLEWKCLCIFIFAFPHKKCEMKTNILFVVISFSFHFTCRNVF